MADLTFPRHVHGAGGIYRICEDAGTYDQAKADGWLDHPSAGADDYREWDGSPLLPVSDGAKPQPTRGRRKAES